jgi:hypothetical protein
MNNKPRGDKFAARGELVAARATAAIASVAEISVFLGKSNHFVQSAISGTADAMAAANHWRPCTVVCQLRSRICHPKAVVQLTFPVPIPAAGSR